MDPPCDSDKYSLVSGENLPQQSSQPIPGPSNQITISSSQSSSYSANNQDELLAIALNLKAGIEHLRNNLDTIKSSASNVDQLLAIITKFSTHIDHVNLIIGKEINRILYLTASPHRSSTFALPHQIVSKPMTTETTVITKGQKKLKLTPNDLLSTESMMPSTSSQVNQPIDVNSDSDSDDFGFCIDDTVESD